MVTIGVIGVHIGYPGGGSFEYVDENGAIGWGPLPRGDMPRPHSVYDRDGSLFYLSDATWDQLVDRMPLAARVRWRGRICTECMNVVDVCACKSLVAV